MSTEAAQLPAPQIVYQDYSPERKAEVIALVEANGGNVKRTADQTGIQYSTIQYWLSHPGRFNEFRQEKRVALADLAENNAYKLGFSIATQDLTDVPLNHRATAFGIMVDKMQLLRGLPTNISENIERTELTVVLNDALADCIDVTPAE